MAQLPLPPPPIVEETPLNRWLNLLWKRVNSAGQVLWSALNFTGSNLTDLETRNHNDLQNIQGGAPGDYRHLTSAQVAAIGSGGSPAAVPPVFFADELDTPLFVPGLPTDVSMFPIENGFVDSSASTISFVDGTRTFTITPTGASYDGYSYGNHFTKTAAASLVIANTEGLHFLYFDATGTLQEQTSGSDDLITSKCFVSVVYWDATNATHLLLGNERHGRVMDSRTHLYLHNTRGTYYESGLGLSSIVADGSGDLATHAEFSVSDGVIWDEDIKLSIADGSPQDLSPIAQVPIYYRSGASGVWRRITAGNFPLAYAAPGTRADWNQFTAGAWQLTEVGTANYVLMHYFATNDLETNQIIGVVGQAEYTTLANAQAGALVELQALLLNGLPTMEFVAIATVIWQTSNAYANTPKSRIRSTDTGGTYIDWRTFRIGTTGSNAGPAGPTGPTGPAGAVLWSDPEPSEVPMMIPGARGPAGADGSSSIGSWVLAFAAAHG